MHFKCTRVGRACACAENNRETIARGCATGSDRISPREICKWISLSHPLLFFLLLRFLLLPFLLPLLPLIFPAQNMNISIGTG